MFFIIQDFRRFCKGFSPLFPAIHTRRASGVRCVTLLTLRPGGGGASVPKTRAERANRGRPGHRAGHDPWREAKRLKSV